MSSITTTPLSAPPRPSSSRSLAPSISGSTLCDYPITTGGNISAFGWRNGNWPALLLGDLQFTAAETNLGGDAYASHNSASANAGATTSSNTSTPRGDRDRDRYGDRDYFGPLISTNTNVSNGTSGTSSSHYSNNSSSNSGSSSSPGIFVTTRTRSHTSSRSASTGRTSTSTNSPYMVGGSSSSSRSNHQASSSVYSPSTGHNQNYNSNPRGLSPNGIGIGRHGPGTAAQAQGTNITTCTSSNRSGGSHKRQPSMATLEQIQTSNAHIVSSLPSGLVAVFVGGTRGIGEATLKQFARYAVAPRVYIVGRDRKDGERVGAELANINPGGEYHYRSADVSLLANVDDVCREIKVKER
ncbi:hypothetical protein N0V85_006933, partial [Neurospora sp. IMI 360204]